MAYHLLKAVYGWGESPISILFKTNSGLECFVASSLCAPCWYTVKSQYNKHQYKNISSMMTLLFIFYLSKSSYRKNISL
jgi:hypothetical protein